MGASVYMDEKTGLQKITLRAPSVCFAMMSAVVLSVSIISYSRLGAKGRFWEHSA